MLQFFNRISQNIQFGSFKQALKSCTEFACTSLKKHSSARKRKHQFEGDRFYVAPKPLALGTRFEMRKTTDQSAAPTRLHCKFAYVPIMNTLRALFRNEQFLRTYLEYNRNGGNGHKCIDHEYIDFCCGAIYQKNGLKCMNDNSLQIQLYQDDFEVCVPIGSKATIHKMCGVYFAIKNWPNNSKLEHIYLVALCNTVDLKTPSTDFNNIWKCVVEDINVLSSDGLKISESLTLFGSLSTVCADNAGANSTLGFAESFAAAHYCRICELSKYECQSTCQEIPTALRTIEKYDESLRALKEMTKVNYVRTKGIKRDCALNSLKHFHVVENFCIDIMHDLAEGVIPFLLKRIIRYCLDKRIVTGNTIVSKIQYFNYGISDKTKIPSTLDLDKHNLNQNASQAMCLFYHIPYILYDYKDQLCDKWKCMESMQKVVQIIYSRKIDADDLIVLRKQVEDHLRFMIECFDVTLLPKHHNLTHYATVIEAVGPLRNQSTIRFEAKHQQFKQMAKNNKNFKDLSLTLASKHQKKAARAIKNFNNIKKISASRRIASEHGPNDHDDHEMHQYSFVYIDDRRFQSGMIVLHENTINEITQVLQSDSGYLLACIKYRFLSYEQFLNSYKIEKTKPEEKCLITFEEFKDYELFEKKMVGEAIFLIARNLEVHRIFNNHEGTC